MTSVIFPRNTTNDINNEKTAPVVKPEYLYAYTDPNASGETLYAWTTDLSDITVSTVYTTDAIPTNTSIFYDENGNVLDITTIRYPMYQIDSFNSGSSTECVFNSSQAMQQ